MRPFLISACVGFVVLVSGCAVHEVQYDQDKIRTALMTLYENQIIDNLIRAANGLPFVQIDYTNATATVTVQESLSVGGSQTIEHDWTSAAVAGIRQLTRLVTGMFSPMGTGSNSNQIAVTANPAITNNEVYDAYLEFLTVPGSLMMTCDPPPPGRAIICRQWRGNYFWVPVELRTLFQRLSLITTSQRGKRLLPVEDFFPVAVIDIVGDEQGDGETRRLTLQLEGAVPNDIGRLVLTVDDSTVRYEVSIFEPEKGPRPAMTDRIFVTFKPTEKPDLKTGQDLKNLLKTGPLQGKLYLENSHPQAPPTDKLLESVRFQLEQIRLNQLRPTP